MFKEFERCYKALGGASLFSIKGIVQTTAFVLLEAAVWTLVGFLPHWLFVTTTILAVLSILVLNAEPYLQQYSPKISRLVSAGTIAAFLGFVGYAFFADFSPPPFVANIRATTDYVGQENFALFMVAYPSAHGLTASPVTHLMYLEIVNNQNFPVSIDSYSVEIGRWHYIPWWRGLPPIPIGEFPICAIGVPAGGSSHPGTIVMKRGTYLFDTRPEWRGELSQCRQMIFSPLLSDEIAQPIGAHQTIQGWAAFDRTSPSDGEHFKGSYLRITIRDSAGTTSRSIVEAPIPVEGEIDTAKATYQPTTIEADLSDRYLKFYSEP